MPTLMNDKLQLSTTRILKEIQHQEKGLAVLIDPDKFEENPVSFLKRLPSATQFLLVGGSQVAEGKTQQLVKSLKAFTPLPIILFPGHYSQLTPEADAVLFLSLLSGSNPEYLINQQIKAVDVLKNTKLEIIPTAYILIDGGCETSVSKTSNTQPISPQNTKLIVDTALAGQYMGKQLIYLEAGSGAKNSVPKHVILAVKEAVKIPIFVGGGIRHRHQLNEAFAAGANVVVMGTAFEK